MVRDPRVLLDPDTGRSRGFGLLFFDSFEASDLAIKCMHGQFLGTKQITVQYAFKKDSNGQRHGSQAERLLAKELQAQRGSIGQFQPNTLFATGVNLGMSSVAPQMATEAAMQMPVMPVTPAPPPTCRFLDLLFELNHVVSF